MKTRIFHTRFWQDDYISSLTPKQKLLFAYLISNDKVNLCGIYELPDSHIMVDTGLDRKELTEIKKALTDSGKFVFYKSWIKIVNCVKFNDYGNSPKVQVAMGKELEYVPKELMDDSILRQSDTPSVPKTEKEKVKDNKDTIDVYNVYLKAYNAEPNRYKLTPQREKKIEARLNDAGKEMLIGAITKSAQNPFYRGENNTGWKSDLDFITRNYETVERLSNMITKQFVASDGEVFESESDKKAYEAYKNKDGKNG